MPACRNPTPTNGRGMQKMNIQKKKERAHRHHVIRSMMASIMKKSVCLLVVGCGRWFWPPPELPTGLGSSAKRSSSNTGELRYAPSIYFEKKKKRKGMQCSKPCVRAHLGTHSVPWRRWGPCFLFLQGRESSLHVRWWTSTYPRKLDQVEAHLGPSLLQVMGRMSVESRSIVV